MKPVYDAYVDAGADKDAKNKDGKTAAPVLLRKTLKLLRLF